MKTTFTLMLALSLGLSSYAQANTPTYSPHQIDALQVTVRTALPASVVTIGDAIRWYVEPMGYYLLSKHPAPDSAAALLRQPVPQRAMMHRTMPLLHAVQLLIGESNTIIIDKKHKLITVQQGAAQ